MAPVASKLGRKAGRQDPDFLVFMAGAAQTQLEEACEGVRKALAWLRGCLEEAAQATVQTLSRTLGPLLEGCARALDDAQRCCGAGAPEEAHGRRPLADAMPLLFVGHVVAFLYAAFVFGYLPAAGLAIGSPVSLAFHALIAMAVASYARVCTTDPGTVPNSSEWRTPGRPPVHLRERKVNSARARWCRKTQAYKPDRAHYCRISGRVVLRMDHHCPWVGNTIGYGNHKHFFLVLLYTVSACALTGSGLLRVLLLASLPPSTVVFILESAGVTLLLSSILVPFFLFHSWLLCRNMTTIEFCEQRQTGAVGGAGPPGGAAGGSRYDLGLYQNLASVMGENPLTWLLPIGGPSGNGLHFPERAACPCTGAGEPPKTTDCQKLELAASVDEEASTTAEENDELPQRGAAGEQSVGAVPAPAPVPVPVPAEDPLDGVLASCACFNQLVQDAAERLVAICCGRPARQSDGAEEAEDRNAPNPPFKEDAGSPSSAGASGESLGWDFL